MTDDESSDAETVSFDSARDGTKSETTIVRPCLLHSIGPTADLAYLPTSHFDSVLVL